MRFFFAIAALAVASSSALAAGYPATVKSCNREVTFDAAPQRAISNDVNLTEMMLALGLNDRMVGYTGVSGWKTLDETLRAGVAELPELSPDYPGKEVLLGADADFFFAGWNYGMRIGGDVTPETLAPFNIAVYELTESCIQIMEKASASMDDFYVDMLNLGTIFDVSDRATALVEGYKADLAAFQSSLRALAAPVSVFVYDSGEDKAFTSGQFGMPQALIEAAGGRNIMDDLASNWADVGWETVIERNPEIVVIVNYGSVTADEKIAFMKSNPAFAAIPAVANDRFVVLEYVEATPGPRNIAAVKRLASAFRE